MKLQNTQEEKKKAPFVWVIVEKTTCCTYLGEKNANIKTRAPCWLALAISFLEFISEDLKITSIWMTALVCYQKFLITLFLAVIRLPWFEHFPRFTRTPNTHVTEEKTQWRTSVFSPLCFPSGLRQLLRFKVLYLLLSCWHKPPSTVQICSWTARYPNPWAGLRDSQHSLLHHPRHWMVAHVCPSPSLST